MDDNFIGPAIGICVIGLLFVLYALVMLVAERKRLYHVWNHLAVVMFGFHTVRGIAEIAFVAAAAASASAAGTSAVDAGFISCPFMTTFLDACRGLSNIAFLVMFCVMFALPPCFEPERRAIFRFEIGLFSCIAVWIVIQIVLYATTAKFVRDAGGNNMCYLSADSAALAAVFLWVPDFANLLLSLAFAWWLNTRRVLLSRRRVCTFAAILIVSSLIKAIGAGFEIHFAVVGRHPAEHHDNNNNSMSAAKMIFLNLLFHNLHMLSIVIAWVWAEDLFPDQLKAWMVERGDCCGDDQQSPQLSLSGAVADEEETSRRNSAAIAIEGERSRSRSMSTALTRSSSVGATTDYGAAASATTATATATATATTTSECSRLTQLLHRRVAHTLTYWLATTRDDILSERNIPSELIRSYPHNIDSQSVVESEVRSDIGGMRRGGGGYPHQRHQHRHDQDDVIVHSTQTFYAAGAAAASLGGGGRANNNAGGDDAESVSSVPHFPSNESTRASGIGMQH